MGYFEESFTAAEITVLKRFFTNVDQPVFALINLPEVVKGALFARYSRSAKSVRRLFLDEFVADADAGIEAIADAFGTNTGSDPLIDQKRAEGLYRRVFFEYGDDSVAQLGGVHLACEQASNILTKVLEWGRLASYLEQSTRYIAYDAPLGDRYRYFVPEEIEQSPLATEYRTFMEETFDTYRAMVRQMISYFQERFPRQAEDSLGVWNATIRAKACDTVRGLLPASTLSNVGIYGSGQAYEMALIRMTAHPLAEVRSYGAMMLTELRKVIPSFLTRVDLPDRGGAWSEYLSSTRSALEGLAPQGDLIEPFESEEQVMLTDWDPDGELKLAAAALYAGSELSDADLLAYARRMDFDERAQVLAALFGDRQNRRHKPGRALERTTYRFDVLCDFGAFRDLQRHRLMTIEWQRLGTRLGYQCPSEIEDVGLAFDFRRVMERAGELYESTRATLGPDVAQYVVPFGFNIRFVMEMNARQACHLIELRTQPAGHPSYRRVGLEMHRQIAEVAGHHAIARAMKYADYSDVELERLDSERRAETRRVAASGV
ncbi:MAG TPA: FAD-dependent thymidylate synthase [Acidimicrobiia bacterium]|nr:FAD-dependent thymidylate synthase [Acidimicrobiia bacterium]